MPVTVSSPLDWVEVVGILNIRNQTMVCSLLVHFSQDNMFGLLEKLVVGMVPWSHSF